MVGVRMSFIHSCQLPNLDMGEMEKVVVLCGVDCSRNLCIEGLKMLKWRNLAEQTGANRRRYTYCAHP